MTDVHEVPIEEVAACLGLTVDVLRLRIRRGKTSKGYKRGGRWYALLPDDATGDAPGRNADVNGHQGGARACYALSAMRVTKRLSSRIAKARKCSPASVSGKRS